MNWTMDAGSGGLRPTVLTLPPETRSVVEARRRARETLVSWDADGLEWAASQLISELTTNAVLHAGTTFVVSLRLDRDRLRCEVSDGSPRPPRVRHYTAGATTGRGMRLVERLSTAWGVVRRPDGKTVWFELDVAGGGSGARDERDAMLDAVDAGPPPAQASRSRGHEGGADRLSSAGSIEVLAAA